MLNSAEYRRGGLNIKLYIQMLNMVLNIDLQAEYRALHSDIEYSAECSPGSPNIELYIRSLNLMLNIYLDDRI